MRHSLRTAVTTLVGLLLLGAAAPPAPAVEAVAASATLTEALAPYAAAPDHDALRDLAEATAAAGVDPVLVRAVLERSAEAGLSAGEAAGVLRRGRDLAREGLPAGPVLGRYLQGLAKGVPLGRIDGVADEMTGRLREAADRLDASLAAHGAAVDPGERLLAIDNGAFALGQGVSPELLDRSLALVAAGDPTDGHGLSASLLALGTLVSGGLEGPDSYRVVAAAYGQGYRGRDLEELGRAVVRAGRMADPTAVADEVLRLLSEDATADRVFQSLDDIRDRGHVPLVPADVDDPARRRIPLDPPTDGSRGTRGGSPNRGSTGG